MPTALKRNSLIVAALAVLFWWAFMHAKHAPALRAAIPFGDDPYDAVGSFALLAGVVVVLIACARAFRPHRLPAVAQRVFLVRSQAAFVLMVLMMVAADAVAMARHPAMWLTVRRELLTLLGGLAAAALLTLWLVLAGERGAARERSWMPGIAAVLAALAILAVYPESLIARPGTHLLTIVVADALLFLPIGLLLPALVPLRADAQPAPTRQRGRGLARAWSAAVVVGLLLGGLAFAGEMSEGSSHAPLGRLLIVACIFVGLGIAGVLIAFACLAKPLGLIRNS